MNSKVKKPKEEQVKKPNPASSISLGSGQAERAKKKLANRHSQIDDILNNAVGNKKKEKDKF